MENSDRFIYANSSALILGLGIYCAGFTQAFATTSLAPSTLPPANLAVEFVPQFVSLGFDDNNERIGIEWTLETLAQFRNHQGLGNSRNFDGHLAKASFFPTCSRVDHEPSIVSSWHNIWAAGHEVGDHTYDHGWGQQYDMGLWQAQMNACIELLSKAYTPGDPNSGVGIPKEDIQGFRAPFVLYNDDTFKAMSAVGLSYDVSIQEGLQEGQDAGSMYWPYTLDEGSPGADMAWWQPNVGAHPGIWSLPLHVLQVVPDELAAEYGLNYSLLDKIHKTLEKFNFKGNKLTAFDFNLFSSDDWMYALTKTEALAVLKYNLDRRLNGNRAPLVLGFHTDYLNGNPVANMVATSPQERREVVAEFLEYALSHKQVRVVRHIDVINWMREPSKLIICADEQWEPHQVYLKDHRVTYNGHLWTARWWTQLELPLAQSWSAWQDEGECVE